MGLLGFEWVLLGSNILFLNGFAGFCWVQTYFLNVFASDGSDGFEWV